MSIHRLTFDTTDTNTQDDSSNVGAYIRSSDGTLITHTTVASDEGLDVYVLNTDLDIRDLDATQDNVAISDGTNTLSINGDGSLNATVTATDLDIRDLTAASDSVASWTHDGTGTAITSTVVGADTGLDVNLINASDLDVDDSLANTAISTASESVTTTSAKLVTSDLSDRKWIWIYNNGTRRVFVGPSGVTTGDGFPLFRGSILEARIGASVAIHAVAAAGTQDVRVMQAS